ncbi:sodium:proton antiporter [Rhodobacteraceae bacterium CCMM004]|nr:sodium:proton antiporter [Rhodobacteraceae bacterium CCMM004]
MKTFAANILLTVAWAMLMGSLSLFTLASGFVLGFAILWVLQPLVGGPDSYFLRVWYWIKLIVMFHYELVVSSLGVIWDILTPQHLSTPAVIDVPLDVKSDAGILLVTNLISLTPGTLSIDVSPDRKVLRVHAMFAEDPEAIVHQLKSGMERWVIDAVEDR